MHSSALAPAVAVLGAGVVLPLCLLVSACSGTPPVEAESSELGAAEAAPPELGQVAVERLWNGEDLAGWHADVPDADSGEPIEPSFEARDGLLISKGSPAGHLITDASYRDYRLTVEYRWPDKPGNCGVLVHASEPRALYGMFPKSLECQLHVGNAGDFWCIGEDIAVDNMVERRGPEETWGAVDGKRRRILNLTDDSEKTAGEWNQMVIECWQDGVAVWVNGELVNVGHDCTASSGQIALQAEHAVCEFRRVELVSLHDLVNADGYRPEAVHRGVPVRWIEGTR